MKLAPGHLPPLPSTAVLDRLPLPLHFSPDLLWRYPLGFPQLTAGQQPPSSPLLDYKSQLPASLASDPRIWSRDDVVTFLRWAEQEFDLQPFEIDVFQMNGKAMCLLTRSDLASRAPGSGDVVFNILQILIRDSNTYARILPSSPVTPTSRHHPYPLSPHPHSHPSTPTWNLSTPTSAQVAEAFQMPSVGHHAHQAAQLAAHLMAVQSQSVTLSPAPSVESGSGASNGSPQHAENGLANSGGAVTLFGISSMFGGGSSGGSGGSGGSAAGSNHSDSEDDYQQQNDKSGMMNGNHGSPPHTPLATTYGNGGGLVPQHGGTAFPQMPPRSPKEQMSPAAFKSVKNEFFPSNGEQGEPNTNGRLLWDFLQQLLNDPSQRYTNYIAWKNRETGVFKIVDPAGLAKLWGIQKNHLSMNYDKMSRALRYYYRVNILRKVQGERHCYQFLRNPTELKNIKNISLLRQQMSPTPRTILPALTSSQQPTPTCVTITSTLTPANIVTVGSLNLPHLPNITIKAEPLDVHRSSPDQASNDYDEKPTDLSMDGPCDLSSGGSRHVTTIVCSPDQDSITY